MLVTRKAQDKDLDPMCKLVMLSTPFADPEGVKHYVKRHVNDFPDLCFVSEDDGKIVGVIVANVEYIEDLAVLPQYRRRGVASDLVNSVLENLRLRGVRSLRADIISDDVTAIRLYDKMGFKIIGENYIVKLDNGAVKFLKERGEEIEPMWDVWLPKELKGTSYWLSKEKLTALKANNIKPVIVRSFILMQKEIA